MGQQEVLGMFSVNEEEFEDTKGVIRIRKSKKNRQYNGQEEKVHKDKQRSTKHTHKTKDRVTRTPLKLTLLKTTMYFNIIIYYTSLI
jgi:hypothetical protein